MTFEELKAFAESTPVLFLALVGLTIALIVTEIARLFRGYKGVRPAELTTLINREEPVVVDLSSQSDFEKGHIVGSRHVQATQFGPEHKLLAQARDRPVVLVCRSGNSASTAAAKLKKAGFTKVHVLEGGIAAWQQAELPLVKGRK